MCTNPFPSRLLDPMTAIVRDYVIAKKNDHELVERIYAGVNDFCLNYSTDFKSEFLIRSGLTRVIISQQKIPPKNILQEFVNHLSTLNGSCVFLLNDTWNVYQLFQKQNNSGKGIAINRENICRDENDYFCLTNLIYKSLRQSNSVDTFLLLYYHQFKQLVIKDAHFQKVSKQTAKLWQTLDIQNQTIWVDLGLQYTFVLFALASVKLHCDTGISQSFYNFTTYPWLQSHFKNHFFSYHSEYLRYFEKQAEVTYKKSLISKVEGSLVGFVVGDALGAPRAGLKSIQDFSKKKSKKARFIVNKKHPIFFNLQKGCYTSNSEIMLLTSQHIIQYQGVNFKNYCTELIQYFKEYESNAIKQRWLGKTTYISLKKLSKFGGYSKTGVIGTRSCAALFRCVPFGLFFNSIFEVDNIITNENLRKLTYITHGSLVVFQGALLVVNIIRGLLSGLLPKDAVNFSLKSCSGSNIDKSLFAACRLAIELSINNSSVQEARKRLGTGSPIDQTLPLSIFYFLKYANTQANGLVQASYSYRLEQSSLINENQAVSLEVEVKDMIGGNTDGISALVGCFLGAYKGLGFIPRSLKSVENYKFVKKLGKELVFPK